MSNQKIEKFNVIGISIRTTNENGQSANDIAGLWGKFMSEGILEKIPNKADNSIYCVYTDYEKDHTKPYTTILGCKVESLSTIPTGMVGKTIDEATYKPYTAMGDLTQGVVVSTWLKIWQATIHRTFTSDFEIYGEKAQDPENAEVAIYVAVKA